MVKNIQGLGLGPLLNYSLSSLHTSKLNLYYSYFELISFYEICHSKRLADAKLLIKLSV